MSWAADAEWTTGRGPIALQIGLATFGILALELALIRWMPGQIRVFAYFSNLVLIGAFLGMGLGVALGRRHPGLVHATLPALLLLAIPLGLSEDLGIVQLRFPDRAVSLWGAELVAGGISSLSSFAIFLAVFLMVVGVFLFAGVPVGHLFARLPPLRAYSADLTGSLCGIGAFTLAIWLRAGPPIWFLIACAPFLWLSRRLVSLVALAAILALSWHAKHGAVYSAYNRIDVVDAPAGALRLDVNRDFHQFLYDLSDAHLADPALSPRERRDLGLFRDVYDLPFQLSDARDRALVVGAGTGNDVQAALRNGYREVFSVEIDGAIIDIGRRLHPERVYDDPRVVPVVNDARAFFEQYAGPPFDVVCYGLLDSHAMFSSMSSLRLENYVYSEEGIRSAWRHVSEQGLLSISFSVFAGEWIRDRLYWTIAAATGRTPLAVYHGMNYGATFIVARDPARLPLSRLTRFRRLAPERSSTLRTVTDDWPFLYVRPGVFPVAYIVVLLAVLLIAVVAMPLAFGRRALTTAFDPLLFFMGAGFLLIEARGVTGLSLLFGSTWAVNSALFASILALVLLANLAVERFGLVRPGPWFAALFAATVLLWGFDFSGLNQYGLLERGLLGGLITALPIGFAGAIVPIVLRGARDPSAALGSNLLGSVVGGCLEYTSVYLGLKAIVLIALVLYGLAFVCLMWRARAATGSAGAVAA